MNGGAKPLVFRARLRRTNLPVKGLRLFTGASRYEYETQVFFKGALSVEAARFMRPSIALDLHREEIRAAVQRRAENPRVFGSVLRGEDGEDSDLDLLVDALPGATLLDLGGLYEDLVQLLDVEVGLHTPEELPLRFRDRVLSEAIPV